MDKKITLRRFLSNLRLDRVDPGARWVRSIFRRYRANGVKTREEMASVHYEREHCIIKYFSIWKFNSSKFYYKVFELYRVRHIKCYRAIALTIDHIQKCFRQKFQCSRRPLYWTTLFFYRWRRWSYVKVNFTFLNGTMYFFFVL